MLFAYSKYRQEDSTKRSINARKLKGFSKTATSTIATKSNLKGFSKPFKLERMERSQSGRIFTKRPKNWTNFSKIFYISTDDAPRISKNQRDVIETNETWRKYFAGNFKNSPDIWDTSNLSFVKYVDVNVTELRETQLGSQLFVDGETKELSSNVSGVLLNTSMLLATIPYARIGGAALIPDLRRVAAQVEILAALIQTDEALLSNAPDEY
ncbi:hypothetical protein WDU94_005856 [Cyamophila willieti]